MSADTHHTAEEDGQAQGAFAAVPDEVLALVLGSLDASGLRRAALVSRRWRRVATSESSWRHAVQRNLGRLPFERLAASWRGELDQRQQHRRAWRRGQRRIGVSARTGTVDHVVAPHDAPWVLALGCGAVTATQLHAATGRLLGRVGPLGGRGSAVAGRADMATWGLQDGRCVCALLTAAGALRSVVWLREAGHVPVLCVAGSGDALGQRRVGGTGGTGGTGAPRGYGLVAAGDARGVVRVWRAESGQPEHVLRAPGEPPLLRVGWALGDGWVAAASARALYVWRLADGHLRHVPLPQPAPAAPLLLAGDPHAPRFFAATAHGAWRLAAPGDGALEAYAAPAAPLTCAALDLHHAADAATARLLCLGDARGAVTVLAADAPPRPAVHVWRGVHGTAVAAVAAGATAVASAGRDGCVRVHDVLRGDLLAGMWARAGGRGAAHAPWSRAVLADLHRTPHVRLAVIAAQLMARRSAAQWAAAVAAGGPAGDSLDRGIGGSGEPAERWDEEAEAADAEAAAAAAGAAGDGVAGFFAWAQVAPALRMPFPSLVAHLAVAPAGVCVANATHVLLSSAPQQPQQPPALSAGRQKKAVRAARREVAAREEVREEVARARGEEAGRRQERVERARVWERVEREFGAPMGLAEDEQVQYALWLSSRASASSPSQAAHEMTEDEQLAYALLLSQDEQ
ncbi:hypothetical protein LPJ53_005750 [Coemansia erecta]|uniref:F-box domain-containing protein n=1 Tax=Coemansia erecta TaxID=147472 RepID=A0A9W8CPG7_9FUNG|nr:hypothetical protein LPJ53_005750 [Coemansia erecta]